MIVGKGCVQRAILEFFKMLLPFGRTGDITKKEVRRTRQSKTGVGLLSACTNHCNGQNLVQYTPTYISQSSQEDTSQRVK